MFKRMKIKHLINKLDKAIRVFVSPTREPVIGVINLMYDIVNDTKVLATSFCEAFPTISESIVKYAYNLIDACEHEIKIISELEKKIDPPMAPYIRSIARIMLHYADFHEALAVFNKDKSTSKKIRKWFKTEFAARYGIQANSLGDAIDAIGKAWDKLTKKAKPKKNTRKQRHAQKATSNAIVDNEALKRQYEEHRHKNKPQE